MLVDLSSDAGQTLFFSHDGNNILKGLHFTVRLKATMTLVKL